MRKAFSIVAMNLTWIYVAGGEPSMAASLGTAASASSECLYQLSYLHPDGFLVPGSALHTQSVSGPNLADGGCPSSHSVADPNGWPQQSSSLIGGADSEAQGTASYGALEGSTRSASSLGGTLEGLATYSGSFDDMLTLTGADGIARFSWSLSGQSVRRLAGGVSQTRADLSVDNMMQATVSLDSGLSPQGFQFDRSFTSGDVIPFATSLFLHTCGCQQDAHNSALLTLTIQYFEADGVTPLSGLTASSMSGTDYQPTPEPGAGLLAITGFVLIAAGAVRGRRRNAG